MKTALITGASRGIGAAIAEKLNKKEWSKFFNFVLTINDIEKEVFKIEINNFKKTNNQDLLKLINIVQNIS